MHIDTPTDASFIEREMGSSTSDFKEDPFSVPFCSIFSLSNYYSESNTNVRMKVASFWTKHLPYLTLKNDV